MTCSIGIASFPHDGNDADTLLRNADTAMYRAKDLGRNTFQLYSSEMNANLDERLTLETDLWNALERNEFVLYYQPKVELATRARSSAWRRCCAGSIPTKGMILPERVHSDRRGKQPDRRDRQLGDPRGVRAEPGLAGRGTAARCRSPSTFPAGRSTPRPGGNRARRARRRGPAAATTSRSSSPKAR